METRAQRGKEMSSSTNMREEIRGKGITEGEASLPARVRGKIEVTERKNVTPKPSEESGAGWGVRESSSETEKGRREVAHS